MDTIQAAILDIKLKHLDEYCNSRYDAAQYYSEQLKNISGIKVPIELPQSTHVYHQYTIKVLNGKRDELKSFLASKGVPSMIYYPLPLQEQEAFKHITRAAEDLNIAKDLAYSVLSLPIHTEMTKEQQNMVINAIKEFYQL